MCVEVSIDIHVGVMAGCIVCGTRSNAPWAGGLIVSQNARFHNFLWIDYGERLVDRNFHLVSLAITPC